MKRKILIIPDIHGRTFWKDAVEKTPSDIIVFLGDYLDPYGYEDISWKEALQNFDDILNYKRENLDKVILLEGNHDAHYHYLDRWARYGRGSRFNIFNSKKIKKIFEENEDLFRGAAYQERSDNKLYLFTHAGVTDYWLKQNKLSLPENEDNISDWLCELYSNEEKTPYNIFGDVGRSRGGYSPSGSPMWADWYDDHYSSSKYGLEGHEDIYQIFGHTQGMTERIEKYAACLDCRKAFLLDLEEEKIKEV